MKKYFLFMIMVLFVAGCTSQNNIQQKTPITLQDFLDFEYNSSYIASYEMVSGSMESKIPFSLYKYREKIRIDYYNGPDYNLTFYFNNDHNYTNLFIENGPGFPIKTQVCVKNVCTIKDFAIAEASSLYYILKLRIIFGTIGNINITEKGDRVIIDRPSKCFYIDGRSYDTKLDICLDKKTGALMEVKYKQIPALVLKSFSESIIEEDVTLSIK